jgi:hypothetical protein
MDILWVRKVGGAQSMFNISTNLAKAIGTVVKRAGSSILVVLKVFFDN